ncbi:MAG TPA: hypothetical protein VG841_05145 [Caulobacterales bacterium]|nr:hypothetical protein [Caulobacterales bacterium]
MGGWRDADGRTARERRKLEREAERTAFVINAKRRPWTLLKGFFGFAFIFVVVIAVLLALR